MAKLINKILSALNNDNDLDSTIEDISICKENLVKNLSNPVFDKNIKQEILARYTDLLNIDQSLQRYSKLINNNYLVDAKEEKYDIEDVVLKGGITNYSFVWVTEESENTCDECKELDGQFFDFYDEVPERPHPNCRCKVKLVKKEDKISQEKNATQNKEQETPEAPIKISIRKWSMPCDGPITSKFGKRTPPVPGASEYHNGWDIAVGIGTPIKAIADGKVVAVGPAKGYGYWVVIDHGNIDGVIVTSEYGHILSWNVKYGQIIKKGEVIAVSGNSGISSGPHLHITIREGLFQGKAVDPSKYIEVNF